MATTYLPPQNITPSPIPNFSNPTNAAAQQVPTNYIMVPPAPLPQTLFGSTSVTSYSS